MILQGMLVMALMRTGASGKLLALMFVNVLLDTLIGSIPVIGQIFDFFYKANQRNLRLTEEYLYEGKHRGSGTIIWMALILLVMLTIALIVYAFVLFAGWVVSWF